MRPNNLKSIVIIMLLLVGVTSCDSEDANTYQVSGQCGFYIKFEKKDGSNLFESEEFKNNVIYNGYCEENYYTHKYFTMTCVNKRNNTEVKSINSAGCQIRIMNYVPLYLLGVQDFSITSHYMGNNSGSYLFELKCPEIIGSDEPLTFEWFYTRDKDGAFVWTRAEFNGNSIYEECLPKSTCDMLVDNPIVITID